MNDPSLAGKLAVVTGASRGIGRAIALELARQAAFVFVGYRARSGEAEVTLGAIRELGGDGAILQMDLRDGASIRKAFAEVKARGTVDVLVNNAALSRDNLFPLMADADWDEVMAVNLRGTALTCRAVVGGMIAAGKGAIVNVASVAAIRGSPGQASYAASKAGVIGLTRTLAIELAPQGIRVNAVVPGMIDAGMARALDHRIAESRRQRIALGRFGTAEEVARVVTFLASDAASYVIGQALVVDGGLSL